MAPLGTTLPGVVVNPPIIAPPPGVATSNTLATSLGPISWTQSSDGTLHASGGGQTLLVNGQENSDGSMQSHVEYALAGSSPYLTLDLVSSITQPSVQYTLSAGTSSLTLALTNIDTQATSGTATLSGTWNGATVQWTGQADLSANPLANQPVGWPAGAFAEQIQKAGFFTPLTRMLCQKIAAKPTTYSFSPGEGMATKALGWCVGGALAGLPGAGESFGLTSVAGCVGGVGASIVDSLISRDTSPSGPIGPIVQSVISQMIPSPPPQGTDGPVCPGPDGGGGIDTDPASGGSGGDDNKIIRPDGARYSAE
jgi:hypothetical protein